MPDPSCTAGVQFPIYARIFDLRIHVEDTHVYFFFVLRGCYANPSEALTFDDVLLVPAYSEVLPRDTQLATQLTRNLRINIPMVSAVMDTVTEARLAIAIAQEGGIGFIHKNMSADQQAAEVLKVKRHEAGVVAEPITIGPDMLVGDVIALAREKHISGLPVVDGKKVLGMVTNRDLRFETRMSVPVSEVMTRVNAWSRSRKAPPSKKPRPSCTPTASSAFSSLTTTSTSQAHDRQGHHQGH